MALRGFGNEDSRQFDDLFLLGRDEFRGGAFRSFSRSPLGVAASLDASWLANLSDNWDMQGLPLTSASNAVANDAVAADYPAIFDLASLDGSNGFRLDGINGNDGTGDSISSAGDFNGDGFGDLIIGASRADPDGVNSAGESYIIFGKSGGFSASMSLASLDGSNGFRIDGIDTNDNSGFSVSLAGDVNGDGFDDIIIGARYADPRGRNAAGESYVLFGSGGGFTASFDLSTIDGSNGFRIDGINNLDFSGWSVSSAGDVNGDGFDDVIIGAPRADPNGASGAGESYVVFGSGAAFSASIDLAALDGSNGFRIDGINSVDASGFSVSSAGDVNGDGFDDIIIGAPVASPGNRLYAGQSYVILGSDDGFAPSIDLASLDGTNGFRIDGEQGYGSSGRSVSSAGDVNGDGFDDVIVGDPSAFHGDLVGSTYVIFGSGDSFPASFDLRELNGTDGFRIDGIADNDRSGFTVSSAGDVNGDGFDDIMISSHYNGGSESEFAAYVVFGKADGFAAAFKLQNLDGSNGFRLQDTSGASVGQRVSSAGDVNGDGFGDMMVNKYDDADGSYIIFGIGPQGDVERAGAAGDQTIRGGPGDDLLSGRGGDDVLWGYAGDDFLLGEEGDDLLIGGAGNDFFLGGTGTDTAAFYQATRGVVVDLLEGTATGEGSDRLDGIENAVGSSFGDVLLGDGGANILTGRGGADSLFGRGGMDTLFGDSRNDELFGGSGDDQLYGQGGNDRMRGGSGDDLLNGGGSDDLLIGGPGKDRLMGGAGDDEMLGGSSRDYADFSDAPGGVVVDLLNGTATGDGNDMLTGIENVTGSSSNDILSGDAGANLLEGTGGEDSVFGRSGNDSLFGGSRTDELFGGTGGDQMFGQGGNDRANGGSGNDTLDGGGNNDLLFGGPGNDVLIGSTGNDKMAGGSGDDTFVFAVGSGDDVLTGFIAGEGTVDTLDFSALDIVFADLSLSQQGDDTLLTTPYGDTILLEGVLPGQLDISSDFIF